jgi:hypothetical protein
MLVFIVRGIITHIAKVVVYSSLLTQILGAAAQKQRADTIRQITY